jgi:hypothetical protein
MQATTQYSEKQVFINGSKIFIVLPKFYARHLDVKIPGP